MKNYETVLVNFTVIIVNVNVYILKKILKMIIL